MSGENSSSVSTAAHDVIIVGLSSTGTIWGVPDVSFGLGQSYDADNNGETQAVKDGRGNTVAVAYFDNKRALSYTVTITNVTAAALHRGKILSVVNPETGTSENYILEDYKLAGKQGNLADYQLSLAKYRSVDTTKKREIDAGQGSNSN